MAPSSDCTNPSGEHRQKHHVVMFPFMAQGHIIPFFQLSKLAARTGFTITIVSTPLNVQALTPTIQSARQKDSSLDIRLAELPFSSAHHGLPPRSEKTDSLPYSQVLTLMEAAEYLQPHFENLIRRICAEDGCTPLCIISDMFLGWTQDVADMFGIPRIFFLTCGVYGTLLYYSMWNHLPHTKTDSEEFTLPDLPHVSLHRSQLPTNIKMATGTDSWSLFQARHISRNVRSWGFICNSFEQLEHRYLEHLRKSTGRPVWAVGPVLPPEFLSSSQSHAVRDQLLQGKEANGTSDAISCLQWLDSQKVSSVLYVSFGSQNTISASNMKELALGLESSGQPFIWVVRPPLGVPSTAEFSSDFLPDGFEERMKTKNQGLVMKKWAPQREILSHPSSGGFLSHCGWNSTLEGLSQGVPIIGWPIAGEQYFNSKLLEEVGVCVEICRGSEGELNKEKVERTVKVLMSEKKGGGMRERAAAMRDAARKAVRDSEDGTEKGSSMRDVDDMIQDILATSRLCQSL
ncbi:hypothetical protein SUGI_0038400 [Cryptomeria japonica]|uniref:UDP-glycosyltransferase 92A1-like n=1 Tax=Cryptomeria japonica TaxID=3369 RepID=UPI002408A237|nr:UDP-glycosyltransferase 92A1-like [Cryptomeria japonica]GLJ06407.1 hypothetical protein SUGI_0038400 [Cryptomeria japonica]